MWGLLSQLSMTSKIQMKFGEAPASWRTPPCVPKVSLSLLTLFKLFLPATSSIRTNIELANCFDHPSG